MNTDVGEPIEYHPEETESLSQQPMHHHMYAQQPQQYYPQPLPPLDFFSSIDKMTYIVMFVAFILGFFMGKTMQPVILRN